MRIFKGRYRKRITPRRLMYATLATSAIVILVTFKKEKLRLQMPPSLKDMLVNKAFLHLRPTDQRASGLKHGKLNMGDSSLFLQRQKLRQGVCENRSQEPKDLEPLLESSLVMDYQISLKRNLKLLYCQIPKAASTNFKRLLMLAEKGENVPLNLTKMHPFFVWGSEGTFFDHLSENTSTTEINNILGSYTKVLLVRHPYERLVSYYSTTFDAGKYESQEVHAIGFLTYQRIIKNYGRVINSGNGGLKYDKQGHPIYRWPLLSFPEFIRYVIDHDACTRNGTWTVFWHDAHWMPISRQCFPCAIAYDLIMKVEEFDHDVEILKHKLGITQKMVYPKQFKRKSVPSLPKYMSQLSKAELKGINGVFEADFQLFGYAPSGLEIL